MNRARAVQAGAGEQPLSYDYYIINAFTTSVQQGHPIAVVLCPPAQYRRFTAPIMQRIADQLGRPTTVFVHTKEHEPAPRARLRYIDIVSGDRPPPITGHAAVAVAHLLIHELDWTTDSYLGTLLGQVSIQRAWASQGEPEDRVHIALPHEAPHDPHLHRRLLTSARLHAAGFLPMVPSGLSQDETVAGLELTGRLVSMYGHTTFLLVQVHDAQTLERAFQIDGQDTIIAHGVLDADQHGRWGDIVPYYYMLSAEARMLNDPPGKRNFVVRSRMRRQAREPGAAADAACAMAWLVVTSRGASDGARFTIWHGSPSDRPCEMVVHVDASPVGQRLGQTVVAVHKILLEAPAVMAAQGKRTLDNVG